MGKPSFWTSSLPLFFLGTIEQETVREVLVKYVWLRGTAVSCGGTGLSGCMAAVGTGPDLCLHFSDLCH